MARRAFARGLASLLLLAAVAIGSVAPTLARDSADRVREVVTITEKLFLYPIHPDAYTEAVRAAQAAAEGRADGHPSSPVARISAAEFDGAISALMARHPAQADRIATAAIRGFTESLHDPYTTWLSARDKEMLDAQQSGQAFTGIGVEVAPDPLGLRVVAALEGTPARGAGLRPGLRIVAVDGTALAGLGLYRASDLLLGPLGSALPLTVQTPDGVRRALRVERARLVIPPVRGGILESEGVAVGYVRIAIFGPGTATEARTIITRLAHQGARAWIIDLRDNPGGTLTSALDIAALFAPGHVLLRVQRRGGIEEARRAPGDEAKASRPVVILMNGGTASSSEVLAGALSDLGIAQLMGERSFGKGVIQSVVPLQDGGALRLTTATYRTPNGRDIHGQGLPPDMKTPTEGDAVVGRALRWVAERAKR